LALARALQGFGAAGIMSVNMALLRFIYPRAWLGRGLGLNALVTGTAAAAAVASSLRLVDVASPDPAAQDA
jgi:DHA2 family multidrug resistance protein-like MFS transporter